MDLEYALSFLKANQPMPNDENLDTKLIGEYDTVRKFFMSNPDERCIPLFLNSFGDGSGYGVYQLVEDVLKKYSKEMVLPHLLKAIKSNSWGIRYWGTQIALEFSDKSLLSQLEKGIAESDVDIRATSIIALSQIKCDRAIKILKEAQKNENECDIKELIEQVLSDLLI